MELLSVKLLVLTLSGAVRIFFGMFPLVLVKSLSQKWTSVNEKRIQRVIAYLMFFGGGVLFATCFLHMMPHVRENFSKAVPDSSFPIAEVVFVAGFFLVYMLEDVVHSLVHRRRHNKMKKLTNASNSPTISGNGKGGRKEMGNGIKHKHTDTPAINGVTLSALTLSSNQDDNKLEKNSNTLPLNPTQHLRDTREIFSKDMSADEIPGLDTNNRVVNNKNTDQMQNENGSQEKFAYTDPDWWRDTVIVNSQINLLSASNYSVATMHDIPLNIHQQNRHNHQHHSHHKEHEHNHDEHGHSHVALPIDSDDESSVGAEIRNLLIIIAISFHGIFEGMAIGLQSTEKDVWYLFLAVSLHECTILFCIGVELISSKTKVVRMVLYILVVSLVCPIGIAIGIAVTEKSFGNATAHYLVVGSFQGLASGTLLYVTFFEIFQEEGRKLQKKYFHIIIAILGFILMGGLELMGGHSHAGGHGHSHSGNGTHEEDDHDYHDHDGNGTHSEADHHHHDHDQNAHGHSHIH